MDYYKLTMRLLVLISCLVCIEWEQGAAAMSLMNRPRLVSRELIDIHSMFRRVTRGNAVNPASIKSHNYRFPNDPPHKLPRMIGLADISRSVAGYEQLHNFAVAAPSHAALYAILQAADLKVLSASGALHALLLGVTIWSTLGFQGWLLCATFFIAGSGVTKFRIAEKDRIGVAEGNSGARGAGSVWGSGAAALVCAVLSCAFPSHSSVFKAGYTSAMAAKLGDTFSSEIGKAVGRRTFLITTLKAVSRGTEGAISMEGSIAGIFGVISMVGIAMPLKLIDREAVLICITAAIIANILESFIGATWQGNDRYGWLTNDIVNILNTSSAAILAILLSYLSS